MGYGKVHRFLLRSVAARGVISMPESASALAQFTGKFSRQVPTNNNVPMYTYNN